MITHTQVSDVGLARMTAMDVIVSATKSGAEIIERGEEFGTIEVGKRADFAVLDSNPLVDIRNTQRIEQVYIGGDEVDRAAIRARLSGGGSFAAAAVR